MSPDHWPVVKELFGRALVLDAERRRALLDTLDDETRGAVAALLAGATAGGPLDEPLAPSLLPTGVRPADGRADAPEAEPLSGSRVGPYRVLERIGRGGMGDVYRARRDDGLFDREVALKVVRADADAVLARFASERRILGALEHPGIARLIAAGVGGDGPARGRPWLALELVEGVPITQAARTLPVRERVQLIVAVCEAVAYAHQRLVVHRDLKPSNVLVASGEARDGAREMGQERTDSGSDARGEQEPPPPSSPFAPPAAGPRVKLLDFGIAKLLDGADAGLTLAHAVRPMTRAYAAPEQVRGEDATTATDVYGLGLLLFEVLTGRRPFVAEGSAALERAILERTPPRPSAHVTSGADARALRSGLDAVCLRALAKAPEARYPTAEAVAADLRRWLDGRPVSARGPSLAYRARRFLWRHRLPVAVAAVAAVVLAAVMAAAVWRVRGAEARTEAALADATVLEEAQGEVLRILDPVHRAESGEDAPLPSRESAEEATAAVEEAYAGRPAVLAGQLVELGTVWFQRGDHARADSLFARAVSLRRAERGDDAVVAQGLAGRGLVAREREDPRAAERFFRAALAIERRLDDDGDAPAGDRNTELYLASVLPDADAQEAALLRSLAERRAARRATPSPEADLAASQAHNEMGSFHYAGARFREALGEFRAAERLLLTRWGETHPSLMSLWFNMSAAHGNLADFPEAERLARQTLAAMQRAGLGDAQQALALSTIGQALHVQGDLASAERELVAALRATERGYGADTPRTAQALQNLAQVHASQGRLADALSLARRSARIHESSGGADSPPAITARAFVAALSFASGDRADALETLTALSRQMPRTDAARPWRISVFRVTADALREMGRAQEAEPMLREVVAFELDTRAEHHPNVLRSRFAYGRTLAALGRLDDARPHLQAVRGRLPRVAFPSVVPDVDAEVDRLLAGD